MAAKGAGALASRPAGSQACAELYVTTGAWAGYSNSTGAGQQEIACDLLSFLPQRNRLRGSFGRPGD